MTFGATYADAPPVFLEAADVRRLWQGEQRIFLFSGDKEKETAFKAVEGLPLYLLASRGGKSVMTNKP